MKYLNQLEEKASKFLDQIYKKYGMNKQIVKLESKLNPPVIPQDWDYDRSVEIVKQVIYKWKNLDDELAIELWVAREILSLKPEDQPRSAVGTFVPTDKTWDTYCKDIGSSRRVINRWLARRFGRKEISSPSGIIIPPGKYQTLIVDPPWPIQKILRDVRPNQVDMPYPTMSIEELKEYPLVKDKAADNCHLYLWTTHKFLPDALEIAEIWGFEYQCLLTWVKNVGMTPFSWMYSTEHILFCIRGNLPLLKNGVRLDFTGKVREHSWKPDEFYKIVKQVSPKPRLNMFGREKRERFDYHGNEPDRF